MQRSRARDLLPWALVALAAFLVHLPALRAGFVWLDHAHLERGLAWQSIGTSGFADTGFYRPLVSLSLLVDHTLGGGAPVVFHVTNLLLHACASVLVYALGRQYGIDEWSSAAAGVVFAVHPLNTLVASGIAFRSEALLWIALAGLLLAHLRANSWLVGVCVFSACLVKETAWGLTPFLLLALAFPEHSGLGKERAPRRVWLAEGVGWLAALSLRVAFAPIWRARASDLDLSTALGTRLGLISRSLRELFLLGDGSLSDATRILEADEAAALAGAVGLVALGLVAVTRRRFGLLAFVSFLPLLQFVPVARWWSPHYLYLPLAFLLLAGAELLPRKRGALAVVFGCALCVCAPRSWGQSYRFRDDESLFRPELRNHPDFREAQFYVAEVERQARRFTQARDGYVAALEPMPELLSYVDRKAAFGNLGIVELELGRPELARLLFRRAKDLSTRDDERRQLNYDEALAAFRMGDFAASLDLLDSELGRANPLAWATRLHGEARQRLVGSQRLDEGNEGPPLGARSLHE